MWGHFAHHFWRLFLWNLGVICNFHLIWFHFMPIKLYSVDCWSLVRASLSNLRWTEQRSFMVQAIRSAVCWGKARACSWWVLKVFLDAWISFHFVPPLLGLCGFQAWTFQIQLSCQSISSPFAGTERIWPWHCSKEKLTQTSLWSSMNGPANWTETLQRWSPLHFASECETWID